MLKKVRRKIKNKVNSDLGFKILVNFLLFILFNVDVVGSHTTCVLYDIFLNSNI